MGSFWLALAFANAPARLPPIVVLLDAFECVAALVPADAPIAVLVYLPDHLLHLAALALVTDEVERSAELLGVDLLVAILVEALEDLLEGLELLLLDVLLARPVALAPRLPVSLRRRLGCGHARRANWR